MLPATSNERTVTRRMNAVGQKSRLFPVPEEVLDCFPCGDVSSMM